MTISSSAGIVVVGSIFLFVSAVFAAHPLITDDTGTQGVGRSQLEVNLEYAHNDDIGVTEHATHTAAALTYGVLDNLDVTVGLPWLKAEAGAGLVWPLMRPFPTGNIR